MARYGRDYGYGDMNRGYGGMNRGYDRDYGNRQRYTFTPSESYGGASRGYGRRGYDRDFGDRMREGWNDLKQGARNMFGGDRDRDRDYYGGGYNRGGFNSRGYDRGYRR